MSQVFLHLPFRNTEHPSQLIGRHPGVGQKIDDALTQGARSRQHAIMVSIRSSKCQMSWSVQSSMGLR
jgi:hypothetical protein